MKKHYRLTQAGVDELKAELATLLGKRSAIADSIKSARELGDLTENSEYQAAIAEKDRNDARSGELQTILQNVEIIKKPRAGNKVQLGSHVMLESSTKTKEFQVVGTVEADPLNGKISDESPIGKALLGKVEGDSVDIVTPNETITYKITGIS